jgi:hypothetical protein
MMAKPIKNSATDFLDELLDKYSGMVKAIKGRRIILILNENPKKVISQDVTVVPMFAPRTSPTESSTGIRPALTNPTSITVAAEED